MPFSFQTNITANFLKNYSFCELKQTEAENNVQVVHKKAFSRQHKEKAALSSMFVFMVKFVCLQDSHKPQT